MVVVVIIMVVVLSDFVWNDMGKLYRKDPILVYGIGVIFNLIDLQMYLYCNLSLRIFFLGCMYLGNLDFPFRYLCLVRICSIC